MLVHSAELVCTIFMVNKTFGNLCVRYSRTFTCRSDHSFHYLILICTTRALNTDTFAKHEKILIKMSAAISFSQVTHCFLTHLTGHGFRMSTFNSNIFLYLLICFAAHSALVEEKSNSRPFTGGNPQVTSTQANSVQSPVQLPATIDLEGSPCSSPMPLALFLNMGHLAVSVSFVSISLDAFANYVQIRRVCHSLLNQRFLLSISPHPPSNAPTQVDPLHVQ